MSYPPEVFRTDPDRVAYVPLGGNTDDATNQHFLVIPSTSGRFLAVWTQSSRENNPDQRVVFAYSDDHGHAWTTPVVLDGPDGNDDRIASWGFPILAPDLGRLYIFYNKNIGAVDVREDTTGTLSFKYSDDDGKTWSDRHEAPIERSAISSTDPAMPENWICYQTPIQGPDGNVLCGFTRWACNSFHSESHLFQRHSECCFLRFENILTEFDPARLEVTTWPNAPHGIRVPKPGDPEHSVAQEPSIQNLPDGRIICLMRSVTGYIWWSVSSDAGETWSDAEQLRFEPGGASIPNPISPCPLYRLGDGRYALIFHNNVGTANGGDGPADAQRNRRPAWLSIGQTIDNPGGQPLAFGEPEVLADSDGVPVMLDPSRRLRTHQSVAQTQIATYGSLFEFQDDTYWWYPDRKHFLVGKLINRWLR